MNDNPYVKGAEGRKEWNDRYGNMRESIKIWKFAFYSSLFVSVIFAVVIVKISMEARVQPFVVETNHGMPYAVKSMERWTPDDQRLVNYALNQFIVNARSVVNDTEAQKVALKKVYAFSANDTLQFFHDYYENNNPYDAGAQYSVNVNIVNALPVSRNTWQITWDESKHDLHGSKNVQVTRWLAHLTYKFGDVNKQFLTDNPFGFYVTSVSWSQSQSA